MPKLYINATDNFEPYKTEDISIKYEELTCPRYYDIKHKVRISETGMLEDKDGHRLDFQKMFCLDQLQEGFEVVAIICLPPKSESHYMIFTMVSLLFLISTFLVFAFNKELRDLHGKFIMCFTATLFVAYISCIVKHIYIGGISEKNYICIVLCKWIYVISVDYSYKLPKHKFMRFFNFVKSIWYSDIFIFYCSNIIKHNKSIL